MNLAIRALLAAGSMTFVAGCASTFGTDRGGETYAQERTPNDHVAQPWLLGEPRYPKAELAKGTSGYVVIDARVNARGELVDVRPGPGNLGPQPFVDAVHDALPMWRFHPPLDAECQPSRERIQVRAWFEVEDGKPKVYVQGEGPEWKGDQPRPIATRKATYPHNISSFRWQDGVIVFAKATIDPQGNVVDTTAKAYPRGLTWLMMPFEDQARVALLDFKFPPSQLATPRHYCTDIVFPAESNQGG